MTSRIYMYSNFNRKIVPDKEQSVFCQNLSFALSHGFAVAKDHLIHPDGRTLELNKLLEEYFFSL
jgi:hypothetical protein